MTLIPYQPELVEEIAARLDLRDPNRRALDTLARALDAAEEPGVELVCDLATATGKSYIAGGLVDYATASGISHILIVCHRNAILTKTRRNFTPGDPKFINGLATQPEVVTADDFQRGGVGQAIQGGNSMLYLFNVQQLLQPRGEMRRRTRDYDEHLGSSLYDHLAGLEDLLVIADEHHAYFGRQFSRSIRDLEPLALIGLTATPHEKTNQDEIVFHYSLAEAIADEYVKVPVLVGRRDGNADLSRILADGVQLLNRKREAIAQWAAANGQHAVQPVLFVVCERIDEADDIAAMLAQEEYLGSPEHVLVVTSESPDEAIEALDRLEDPDSPVQAVVSVQMLQEGWDVKNIYVVATTRALESRALSEQILGRGLRLPYGERTGHQMLDTVEVLSHRRFREILESAGELLEAFFEERSTTLIDPTSSAATDGTHEAATPSDTGRADALVTPGTASNPADADTTFGLQIVDAETRLDEINEQAFQLQQTLDLVEGADQFTFPQLVPTLEPQEFTLSDIPDSEAREAGHRYTDEIPATLQRRLIDMERVDDQTGEGVRVTTRDAEDTVEATQLTLGVDDLRHRIRNAVLGSRYVERTRREGNAVNRLIGAFLEGAGVAEDNANWGEARVRAATDAFLAMVKVKHHNRPSRTIEQVNLVRYPRTGTPAPDEVFDRSTAFVAHRWYSGWNRNVLPVARFDAKSTEFAIASILDTDPAITWWCRIETAQEVRVPYQGGNYYPDFLAVDANNIHYLIEGKSDIAATDPDVIVKKTAAERWARHVNDSGDAPHTWRYLFAAESAIRGAAGSWTALVAHSDIT